MVGNMSACRGGAGPQIDVAPFTDRGGLCGGESEK